MQDFNITKRQNTTILKKREKGKFQQSFHQSPNAMPVGMKSKMEKS